MSKKRIMKEFQKLQGEKPHGISVSVPTDNISIWEADFTAPEQSLYKDAKMKLQLVLPDSYPLSPPVVRFLTPVYHVNIDQKTGHVCLGLTNEENWKPTNEIADVVRGIFSLLIKPNEEAANDQSILTEFQENNSQYSRKARASAKKFQN